MTVRKVTLLAQIHRDRSQYDSGDRERRREPALNALRGVSQGLRRDKQLATEYDKSCNAEATHLM